MQNQTGPHKTRWSRTGTVMEVNQEYNQYHVKMDGSRRTTARNRKFLRKIRAVGPGPGHGNGETVGPRVRPEAAPAPTPGQGLAAGPGATPVRDHPVGNRADTGAEQGLATPARPAGRSPGKVPAGIPLQPAARKRVSFGDMPTVGHSQDRDQADGARQDEPVQPVQPAQPVRQQQEQRPARDGGRPTRSRRMPSRYDDYELGEMSVMESVRRAPSPDWEDDGVGGMTEDDSPYQQSDTGITGPELPAARTASHATRVGRIILGLKDLLEENGVDTAEAAKIIGRVAMEI